MARKRAPVEERGATAWATIALTPLLLSLLSFASPGASTSSPAEPAAEPTTDLEPALDRLEHRANTLGRALDTLDLWYRQRMEPVERVLRPFHDDPRFVRRVAFSLVRNAEAVGMDPRALASVLLVENPWLDPSAESFVGAVGLMQVMPFHAGNWECGSSDLRDLDVNICHGARIFAHYLTRAGGDLDRALLAYNGCVAGTNTPDCHRYPSWVYSRAGRAAMMTWVPTEQ